MTKAHRYQKTKARALAHSKALILAGQEIGPLPPVKNPQRRARADLDFRYFCESYFPRLFSLAWSEDHLKVIHKIEQAVLHGGLFAMAMPRGSGKTSLCQTAALWALLIGQQPFVFLIAATAEYASAALNNLKSHLSGNPLEYHVLRNHPGDRVLAAGQPFDRIPASSLLHYYRAERPGQQRGIPEITPALPLFAQLRRYTLAVIAAAETAADFAAVLYTDAPANGEADPVEPMDLIELERRMATVLPGGWKLGQVAAEQPATTYGEFKHEILNEIARCLNMPFNVAAGNSSGYNYASGRLDHQVYYKSIRVEQAHLGRVVLNPLLRAWLDEAVLIEGFLPQSLRATGAAVPHQWFWDGQEHVDPLKEANAQATRLENHTTTLAYEYARQGKDWEAELRQRAKEVALMESLGLPLPTPAVNPATPAVTDNQEEA